MVRVVLVVAGFLVAVSSAVLMAGAGTSATTDLPGGYKIIPLQVNDLVYDPTHDTIWASVPSASGVNGNSLIPIDASTGDVGDPVFVGSEPGPLAISDDGSTIFVGLSGANAVREFDTASKTPGDQFPIGRPAENIAVEPGSTSTVAVSTIMPCCSDFASLAIYDDGVKRTKEHTMRPPANIIAYAGDPAALYGANIDDSGYDFARFKVDPDGVSLDDSASNLRACCDLDFSGGLFYTGFGTVLHPDTLTLAGTFQTTTKFNGRLALDPTNRIAYFRMQNFDAQTLQIEAFTMDTFLKVETLVVPDVHGESLRLDAAGEDRLVASTDMGEVVLIAPSTAPRVTATPLITVTPPPTPTPSPQPTLSPRPGLFWGDFDCDEHVNARDALVGIQSLLGLTLISRGADCPMPDEKVGSRTYGDVDCNGVHELKDDLYVLRYAAGRNIQQEHCPVIGQQIS